MVVGTREQVWAGTADKTSGGLTKDDLVMDNGKIKSKRMIAAAKARFGKGSAGRGFAGANLSANQPVNPDAEFDPDTDTVRFSKASDARRASAAQKAFPPKEKKGQQVLSVQLRSDVGEAATERGVREQIRSAEGLARAFASAKSANPLAFQGAFGAADPVQVAAGLVDELGMARALGFAEEIQAELEEEEEFEEILERAEEEEGEVVVGRDVIDNLIALAEQMEEEAERIAPEEEFEGEIPEGPIGVAGFGFAGVTGAGFFEDVGKFLKKAAPSVGRVLKKPETAAALTALGAATGRPELAVAGRILPAVGGLLGGSARAVSPAAALAAELVMADTVQHPFGGGKKLQFAKRLGKSLIRLAPKLGRLLRREEVPQVLTALGGLVGQEKAAATAAAAAPKIGEFIGKFAGEGARLPGQGARLPGQGALLPGQRRGGGFFDKVFKAIKKAAPKVGRVLKKQEVADIAREVGKAAGQPELGEIGARILPEFGSLLGGGFEGVTGAGFFQDLARGLKKAAPVIGRTLRRPEVATIIREIGKAAGQKELGDVGATVTGEVGSLLGGGTEEAIASILNRLRESKQGGAGTRGGVIGSGFARDLASAFAAVPTIRGKIRIPSVMDEVAEFISPVRGAPGMFVKDKQFGGAGRRNPLRGGPVATVKRAFGGGAVLPGGGAVLPGGAADYRQGSFVEALENFSKATRGTRGIARGAQRNGAGAVGTRGIARGAQRNGAGCPPGSASGGASKAKRKCQPRQKK